MGRRNTVHDLLPLLDRFLRAVRLECFEQIDDTVGRAFTRIRAHTRRSRMEYTELLPLERHRRPFRRTGYYVVIIQHWEGAAFGNCIHGALPELCVLACVKSHGELRLVESQLTRGFDGKEGECVCRCFSGRPRPPINTVVVLVGVGA